MPDTLDRLRDRIRLLRRRWRPLEWARITVTTDVFSQKPGGFVGTALIDGRRRVDLFNGHTRCVAIEPDEHRLVIYFGPQRRNVRLGKAVCSFPFFVRPGERLRLVFLERPEWKGLASRLRRESWRFVAWTVLVAAVAWIGYPLLREAIATTTLALGVQGFWLSFCYMLVKSRIGTMTVALCLWVHAGGFLLPARCRRLLRKYEEQYGQRFCLAELCQDDGTPAASAA